MNKRVANQKLKLCVLSKIKEEKNILFGAFSDKLTKQDKVKTWKEIFEHAKAVGVMPSNKDWTYLRDVWWPNVKKLTTLKIDNANSTGTGGGKDKILNEVDNEVLDIIGKESPVIIGLDVAESMELTKEDCTRDTQVTEAAKTPNLISKGNNNIPKKRIKTNNNSAMNSKGNCSLDDRRKELQILLLEHQIHKTKLECQKLSMEMGLPTQNYSNIETEIVTEEAVVVNDDETNEIFVE